MKSFALCINFKTYILFEEKRVSLPGY